MKSVEERYFKLDIIRIVAMSGVLLDHLMANSGHNMLICSGIQVGGGCVEMFFAISCFIFGQKWMRAGCRPFGKAEFARKRFLRIYIPLWISIVLVLPVEYLVNRRFEMSTIFFNVIGLGWAKPFGVAGHLWFITMLMIMYFGIVAFSHIRIDKIRWYYWIVSFVGLLLFCWLLKEDLTTYSKIAPLWFIFFGALVFAKGNEIVEWCGRNRVVICLSAFFMVFASQLVYIFGLYDTHKVIAAPSCIIAGFLTFCFLMTFVRIDKENKTVKWLSDLSYEVYLVHVPVIELLFIHIDDKFAATVVTLMVTLLMAMGVKCVEKRIRVMSAR